MKYRQELIDRASKAMPSDLNVVAGSTPVVSFGNPANAKVATLGINPSSGEFSYGKDRPLLSKEEKRLVDHDVLQIKNPRSLTLEESQRVIEGCNDYFKSEKHYEWFLRLEEIVLSPAGYTYYGGNASACHLDLVQWATDPVWGSIKAAVKKRLLSDDKEFLRFQLTNYKFDFVYLNGGTVIEQFLKLGIAKLSEVYSVTRNSKGGTPHKVYKGTANGTTYLGWGINAASRDANKIGLTELSNWIKNQ